MAYENDPFNEMKKRVISDAPVWVRGEVVGVLCHEHIGPACDWSAEEIDFVSALAAMVSLAIEESKRAHSERLLRRVARMHVPRDN